MATISELLVRVRPEGISETQDELDGLTDEFEQTADQTEDSADKLEKFSQRFRGAMNVAIAGLAVGTAGLLSQVPIVSELMDGLFAIVDALALKIDGALRPHLNDVTLAMHDLANEIFESEGPLEGLKKIAEAVGDLGKASISFAVEDIEADALTKDLLKIVFPKLGEDDILDTIFSFDMEGGAVLGAIFGALSIGFTKFMNRLFGWKLSPTGFLRILFPVLLANTIVDTLFEDIGMEAELILTAIFTGVIIKGSSIIATLFAGVSISGTLIVVTLFAGVTITSGMILDEIFEDGTLLEQPGGGGDGDGGPGSLFFGPSGDLIFDFINEEFTPPEDLRNISHIRGSSRGVTGAPLSPQEQAAADLLQNFTGRTIDFAVNLDGRTIADVTEPFLGDPNTGRTGVR